MKPRIKICCITSVEEARTAVRHGVDAIGLVSDLPSGPQVLEQALIAEITAAMRGDATVFALTSLCDPASIIDLAHATGVDGIQLVDRVEEGAYAVLRRALRGRLLLQVVHVGGEAAVTEALRAARLADILMLDSGGPGPPVQVLGGTGRVHDWTISRRIREQVRIPVYLAGGLRPENVERAIETVRPDGIDVCNGVRANSRLDEDKLGALMERMRGVNVRS